jgi:hypothetical protein
VLLEREGSIFVSKDDYGYWLNLGEKSFMDTLDSVSEDIVQIIKIARENECDYVRLDRDGPFIKEIDEKYSKNHLEEF